MRRSAFSLTEILVVSLVAGVALVPIYGLLTSNARQVSFNLERSLAHVLASQVLERYRYEDFQTLRTQFATPELGEKTIAQDNVLNECLLGLPPNMEDLYRRFSKREAVFVEYRQNLLGALTCTVRWNTLQGQPREVTVQTLVRNLEFHYGK